MTMNMTLDEKRLLDTVELGIQAEAFKASPVGKTLCLMAQLQADDAMAALKQADPHNAKTVQDLQNVIWRGESFCQFLDEIIADGRQAADVLKTPAE